MSCGSITGRRWKNAGEAAEEGGPAGSSSDFSDSSAKFFRALERERRILEKLPADFFDRLETGIGHEDFTPDNMLFSGNEVSAILDFDRSQYGFRLHDVGRAILSFALKDGKMDLKKAYAFLEGYGEWMLLEEAAGRMFRGLAGADAFRFTSDYLVY